MEKIKIVGIVGSLRKGSYNRMLMDAAIEVKPEDCVIEVADISQIPLYNQDNESEVPQPVVVLKEKIKSADAILVATPEYNYSIPGVLKNAIDWASRPYDLDVFSGKAVGLMSASIGQMGGGRAQYHLRQSFVFLNAFTINKPEVMVSFAPEKFDGEGRLKDDKTKEVVRKMLVNLIELARILKQSGKVFEKI